MRVGGIGGVVDDTNVKRGGIEINDSIFGSGLVVGGLSNGGKVRAGFHFDDGEVVFGVFIDKGLVLEEGT